jgi:AcrR family transcriptional regulator
VSLVKTKRFARIIVYARRVPRLWNDTIDEHRRDVRDAIMEATVRLVREHGVSSVSMSQVATASGIGRATLYKYFPDVRAILTAWHERQVAAHLAELTAARDRGGDAIGRVEAVLETYALLAHEHHGTEIVALLHRGEHVTRAYEQLTTLLRDLVAAAARAGKLRSDVPAAELARYALHALGAAGELPGKAAVKRLVAVTLAGLRPV